MPLITVLNKENDKKGEIELDKKVFGQDVNPFAIQAMVRYQLARRRSGTASTKTRGEMEGGGRKPWRQKGTGRARAGTDTSPLWVGGGVAFGPHPQNYSFRLPKKVRLSSLKSALSHAYNSGKIIVLEELSLQRIKTKDAAQVLKKLNVDKGLIVLEEDNFNLIKSTRNIPGIDIIKVEGLNTFDVLRHKRIIFTRKSIKMLEEIIKRRGSRWGSRLKKDNG